MSSLKNLTPHPIVLRLPSGEDVVVPPSGIVPRVETIPGALEDVGLPIPVQGRGATARVVPMPEPEEGVWLIVSGMVLAALAGSRPDVVAPGTGPNDGTVRDDAGRILAVTRFVR